MTEGTSDIDTQTMSALIHTTLHGNGDSDGHLMSILGLALGLRAKRILELGVRQGRTTLPLLMAAKLTGGMVVSVDIQDTAFEPPMALMAHWTFVKMDALEFLRTLDTSALFGHLGSVSDTSSALDLVYIDDWHSYHHVKAELEALDKHVSPRTILLLHDLMYMMCPYYHSEPWKEKPEFQDGGPYRAVAELNARLWEFSTVPVCHGLTILRKKYSSASVATFHKTYLHQWMHNQSQFE